MMHDFQIMSVLFLIILSLLSGLILFLLVSLKFGYVDCDNYVCLVGKTALVTGGSSGIGYEIVLSLASRGCRVIIADKIVNETIKLSIIEETDNPNIVLEYVDFASFESIRNFAEKLNCSEEKLDILVNNVGVGLVPDTPTKDGLNPTMQINYYGPFLLTNLLIELLKKSTGGRIIFTSSITAFVHNMFPDCVTSDVIKVPHYRMQDYTSSKFMTVVASDLFAEKLKPFNITCNVYHPLVVYSGIFKISLKHVNYYSLIDFSSFISVFLMAVFLGAHPRKAAQAGINLAVSKKFKNTTGVFFGKYWLNLKPRYAGDKMFCKKIWRASEKTVGLKPE